MNASSQDKSTSRALIWLVILWAIGLLWSGWKPHDRITWVLEVFPCFIAFAFMLPTRASFELTALVYWLIAVHGLILMLGGAYTYAHVPLGFWMQD